MLEQKRDPLSPIKMRDEHDLPMVWLIIIGLVIFGFIATFTINLFASGGLVIWPFIFAVSVLLLLNEASDANGVGVPPLQAYGLFGGIIVVFFLFVALVSRINPWVVILFTLAAAAFAMNDWRQRQIKQREMEKRRLAGVCVRCLTPVGKEIDEECSNCGYPVNSERVSLMRLGRAIAQRSDSTKMRAVLGGQKQQQAPKKASGVRPITKAYSYGKKK
jgi:hypothetical protein